MPKLKTLAVPALIFLLLMAAAQPASAANWVELGKDSEEETWSIDRDSVQTKGSIVSVWVKIEYPNRLGTPGAFGTTSMIPRRAHYSLILFEFDFSDRTFSQVAQYDYGANGELQGNNATPSGWGHIAPDTVAENVYSTLKKWLNR